MSTKKLFATKSDIYASSRPGYPPEIYDFLKSISPSTERAWDCACGSGQVAVDLAKSFKEVEATDTSAEQIKQAIKLDGVNYTACEAEHTVFPENYFDLVCVAQALHWFDLDQFWIELRRVLKPQGIFATWGYNWPSVSLTVDGVLDEALMKVIEPYWSKENELLWNHYLDIDLPFTPLEVPEFQMRVTWSLEEFFSYLHTWSATRLCMDKNGEEFFSEAYEKVSRVWGEPALKRPVKMDFFFLATQNDI